LSLAAAALLISLLPAANPFPTPTGLDGSVRFWVRVFSEWPTNRYAIHDDQDLEVIYMVIAATDGRSAVVKKAKSDVEAALARLDERRPRSEKGLKGIDLQVYRALTARSSDAARFARARGHVRHQKGQRDRFAVALRDSGRFRPQIEHILESRGVPGDLIALVFVESMFKFHARSHSGALGIWQFMPYTGKEYLNINSVVDERRDPIIASYAAASYLSAAHKRLKVWPVAITSYNYGMNGMARAIQAVGSHDLAKILKSYRSGRLGFAAKNYYVEYLAALEIWRHPKRYFPEVTPRPPWRYDVVRLPAQTTVTALVRAGAVGLEELEGLNPALTRDALSGRVPLPQGLSLRLPSGTRGAFLASYSRIRDAKRVAEASGSKHHVVKQGDTVTAIARRHGVSTGQVLAANDLRREQPIYVGMQLTIPPKRTSYTLLPEARGMAVPPLTTRRGVAVASAAPPPPKPAPPAPAPTPVAAPVATAPVATAPVEVAARTPPTPPTTKRTMRARRARVTAGPPVVTPFPAPSALEEEIAVDVLSGARALPVIDVTTGFRAAPLLLPALPPAGQV